MSKFRILKWILLGLLFVNLIYLSINLSKKNIPNEPDNEWKSNVIRRLKRPTSGATNKNRISLDLDIMDIYRLDVSCDYIVNDLGAKISDKYVNRVKNCTLSSSNSHDLLRSFYEDLNKNVSTYRPLLNMTRRIIEFDPFNERHSMAMREFDQIQPGGVWNPPVTPCGRDDIDNVLFIVPFTRSRMNNLKLFLVNMHAYLTSCPYFFKYRLVVVEQVDFDARKNNFNKGRLFNAAFKHALEKLDPSFDCVVLHDVDLVPSRDGRELNEHGDYRCRRMPWHLSNRVFLLETGQERVYNQFLTGGILSLRVDHFIDANGFSNEYFGWGAEGKSLTTFIFALRKTTLHIKYCLKNMKIQSMMYILEISSIIFY